MSPTNSYSAQKVLFSEELQDENAIENTPNKNMQAMGHIVGFSSFNSHNSRTDKNSHLASHKSNRSNSLRKNMQQFRKSRPNFEPVTRISSRGDSSRREEIRPGAH